MFKLPQDILQKSAKMSNHTRLPGSFIVNKNVKVSSIDIRDEIMLSKTSGRVTEKKFSMCWDKLMMQDDIYLNQSDWYAVEVFENGKFEVAAIFCVNQRHPEFLLLSQLKGEKLKSDELFHLSEVEIAPNFRGSAYDGGVKSSLENPHVFNAIFNMLFTTGKSAGYKMLTLQALNSKVAQIYRSNKVGFVDVTEDDSNKVLEYIDSLSEEEQKNLENYKGTFKMLLENKEFYFGEHPFMIKNL